MTSPHQPSVHGRRGRRRSGRTRPLVAAVLLLLASSACFTGGPDRPRRGGTAPATPGASLPDTVQQCQRMFDTKNDGTWRAADGVVSVALPHGKIAWLFGDTHREPNRFVHNSILVQEGQRLTSTTGGQAIPPDRNGDYYWPTDGVVDGGLLRVFLGRITRIGGSYQNRGVALATFRFDSRGYPIYVGKRSITYFNEDVGIQWGTAVVRDGGQVYVYGQQRRRVSFIFGRDVYLARVAAGELVDRSSWRYWTGAGWVADEAQAAAIERAGTGRFASNFSVDKVGHDWLVVSKEFDTAGDRIIGMRAGRPMGPFTITRDIPTPSDSQQWSYQAKGHPELPLADGKTLVTWNVGFLHPGRVGEDFHKPRCGGL